MLYSNKGQENDSPIGEVGKIEEIQISAASCTWYARKRAWRTPDGNGKNCYSSKYTVTTLAAAENLDIFQLEEHRTFGIKLIGDAKNQERIIANTKTILERKQLEVKEAYQKVETLKKLKEKQEKEFYKEFLHAEMKEIDDITSARFKIG